MNNYKNEKEVIKRIKESRDWYNKSFAGYLFGIHEQGWGIALGTNNPLALKLGILFINENHPVRLDWFWDADEMRENREKIIKKSSASKDFADEFYNSYKDKYDDFVGYYKKVADKKISSFTNKELRDILKKFHDLFSQQAALGYVVDNFLTNDKEDWLVLEIKKELKDRADYDTIAHLTQPVFTSFVNDYDSCLNKIARKLAGGFDIKKDLKNVSKNFKWIKTTYREYGPIGGEEIVNEVKNLGLEADKIVDEKVRIKNNKILKNKLYKEFKISEGLQNIIYTSEIFTHVQDKRKECVLRSNFFYFMVLDDIARRFGQEKTTTYCLTIEEAIFALDGNVNWTDIEKRKSEPFVLFYFNGKYELLYKSDAIKKFDFDIFFPENKNITEFKGTPAYMGLASGRVHILKNSKDISLFNDGDVLVTNQTTPEFVPAMKKAIAVITDQGGITCHAAIVSRELKKVCIIGTKIATKVLKDGDMVEVDANKGIVKILNTK